MQVFRRENAPYEQARYFLSGIDGAAQYIFTDLDNESEIRFSGEELLKQGFTVTISDRRTAKIWQYRKL